MHLKNRVIEKKDRDKRFIQKTYFLAAYRFKNYFKTSLLISSQQTAYVKNRHISESGRLISHIAEIAKIKKKTEGFLVTMNSEKAFDSLDHNFLICGLEK